jgi:hypothetical protein
MAMLNYQRVFRRIAGHGPGRSLVAAGGLAPSLLLLCAHLRRAIGAWRQSLVTNGDRWWSECHGKLLCPVLDNLYSYIRIYICIAAVFFMNYIYICFVSCCREWQVVSDWSRNLMMGIQVPFFVAGHESEMALHSKLNPVRFMEYPHENGMK